MSFDPSDRLSNFSCECWKSNRASDTGNSDAPFPCDIKSSTSTPSKSKQMESPMYISRLNVGCTKQNYSSTVIKYCFKIHGLLLYTCTHDTKNMSKYWQIPATYMDCKMLLLNLKSHNNNSTWGLLLSTICTYMKNFLSYASSAILCMCHLLLVYKNAVSSHVFHSCIFSIL